jgi:riboflavin kinase/FMN adenylyltransferase
MGMELVELLPLSFRPEPLPNLSFRPSEASGEISSTQIRAALENGDIASAEQMLGYAYSLKGAVVAGNRLGRTIGFPTANMKLCEPLKLVPGRGVYAVDVEVLGRKFRGMTNIGTRPTVGGVTTSIETHILDFDEDIYGLPLRITFLRRLRDEVRFPSLEELKAQLEKDKEACREHF